jgi:hypothetical protein
VHEGSSFFFTANVAGGDAKVTATYNWIISAGNISKGQGTSTIEVATNGLGTQTITATVEVGGYRRDCATTYSASAYVVPRPTSRKVAEFGHISVEEKNSRIDTFSIELANEPGTQGYVIGYGGRSSRAGTGQKAADAIKKYLVSVRKMDPTTLVTIDGGYKEEVSTELWIVPAGALPPTASPTVDSGKAKSAKPVRKSPIRRSKNQE